MPPLRLQPQVPLLAPLSPRQTAASPRRRAAARGSSTRTTCTCTLSASCRTRCRSGSATSARGGTRSSCAFRTRSTCTAAAMCTTASSRSACSSPSRRSSARPRSPDPRAPQARPAGRNGGQQYCSTQTRAEYLQIIARFHHTRETFSGRAAFHLGYRDNCENRRLCVCFFFLSRLIIARISIVRRSRTHTAAAPQLQIEFREDMVRRPHMNAKGRCIVDVRIHASPPIAHPMLVQLVRPPDFLCAPRSMAAMLIQAERKG
jgi:hypothetical protein